VVTNTLVFFLTGAEAERSDIPAGVPMRKSTPGEPEVAGAAPKPMEEVVEEAAVVAEGGGSPRRQRSLWRWLSAPQRSKTQSPSALHR
jgi:hypothetical protein